MTWSKSYSSPEQMEQDTEVPENATSELVTVAKGAAKVIIDSGVIPALEKAEGHESHADSKEGTPQVLLRISIGGHAGKNPSMYVSVSGA